MLTPVMVIALALLRTLLYGPHFVQGNRSSLCGNARTHLGSIKNVTIHRDSFFEPRPFVLVEMNSPIEVHRVIREIGDCSFGSAALVRLVQDQDQCSFDADISRFGSAPASQAYGAQNSST